MRDRVAENKSTIHRDTESRDIHKRLLLAVRKESVKRISLSLCRFARRSIMLLTTAHFILCILYSSCIIMTVIASAGSSPASPPAVRRPEIPILCPGERQAEADECASILFLIGKHSKSRFPVTIAETDAYCRFVMMIKSFIPPSFPFDILLLLLLLLLLCMYELRYGIAGAIV